MLHLLAALAMPMAQSASVSANRCLDPATAKSLVTLHPRGSRLTAVIAPSKGGQLVGLQLRRDGRQIELLHRGMNFCPIKGFDGKAMVMWPATGRTYADDPTAMGPDRAAGWRVGERRYLIPIHGFARTQHWQVVDQHHRGEEASVTVRLTDTPETRALYPYAFRFSITYTLRGNRLSVAHRIENRSGTTMPFAIGNHITFATPLADAGRTADTNVSVDARQRVTLDKYGRPTGVVPQAPLRNMPISQLGEEQALPILTQPGHDPCRATIAQPGVGTIGISHQGSVKPDGTPVAFNLWGNAARGFFSVEPWIGKQNALATGDGLILLRKNTMYDWKFVVDVNL